MSFAVGRSGFHLTARANVREKRIYVRLVLTGEDGKPHFYLLGQDRIDIEEEIGAELEWGNPGRKEKHISLSLYDTDPGDRQDWNRQHQWLCDKLEVFHKVFSPRVKTLDASDYVPE